MVQYRLCPIPKTGRRLDDPSGSGFRPVAVGEVPMRVLSRLLLRKLPQPTFDDACPYGGCQYGIGVSRAPEAIAVLLDSVVKLNDNICIAHIDIHNGFGDANREALMMALDAAHLEPEVTETIRVLLEESVLRLDEADEIIPNRKGTLQGLSISSALFGLLIGPALRQIVSEFAPIAIGGSDSGVSSKPAAFFIDDGYLWAEREEVLQSMVDRLRQFLRPLGLSLSASKCEVLGRCASVPSVDDAPFKKVEMLSVLGFPVTRNSSLALEQVQSTMRRALDIETLASTAFDDVPFGILSFQSYLLIMRLCVVPMVLAKLRYALADVSQLAAEFDGEIRRRLMTHVGVSDPQHPAGEVLVLPLSLSGVGIAEVTSTLRPALLGTIASLLTENPLHSTFWNLLRFLCLQNVKANTVLESFLSARYPLIVIDFHTSQLFSSNDPVVGVADANGDVDMSPEWTPLDVTKLQHRLWVESMKERRRLFEERIRNDPYGQCFVFEDPRFSSALLSTFPVFGRCLSNDELRFFVKQRLMHIDAMTKIEKLYGANTCLAKGCRNEHDVSLPGHYETCFFSAGYRASRHHDIVRMMAAQLMGAGFPLRQESRMAFGAAERISNPDISMTIAEQIVLIDVTIVSAASQEGQRGVELAVKRREAEKAQHYQKHPPANVGAELMRVVPAVLATNGHFGEQFLSLLRQLRSVRNTFSIRQIRMALSVVLARADWRCFSAYEASFAQRHHINIRRALRLESEQ